ncbi:DNA mismatch repair protein MSH6-like [Phoenix dactylifera]|uniref:DNA mismatch repair protein MSH6-like n=1 Tax=Phoenix dactylifera TaxID=42345 RepID=A0A8B8ZHI9_PHODC|nr:DNA mismatch repair protein MSH6-like [Phoenix dactylifera]
MAPPRRLSNGRSPLVRKQSQITAFFSLGKGSQEKHSPSPSPNPSSSPSAKPSPDPSPSLGKKNKPLLVIPPSPASNPRTPPTARERACSEDVVGRRIRVFWPLDKAWHEGSVKSFDEASRKHLVEYDDAEEESLDLGKEKFEWVEEEPSRRLRRLRRMSDPVETPCSAGDVEDGSSAEDSTDDEEWGKGMGKDMVEDDSEEEIVVSSRRSRSGNSSEYRKRKKIEVAKLDCAKKVRFDGDGDGEKSASKASLSGIRTSTAGSLSNFERGQVLHTLDSSLTGEAAERFGKREAERFRFLGE